MLALVHLHTPLKLNSTHGGKAFTQANQKITRLGLISYYGCLLLQCYLSVTFVAVSAALLVNLSTIATNEGRILTLL